MLCDLNIFRFFLQSYYPGVALSPPSMGQGYYPPSYRHNPYEHVSIACMHSRSMDGVVLVVES